MKTKDYSVHVPARSGGKTAKHTIIAGLEDAVKHAKVKPLRPMLSAKVESLDALSYPLLASPKLDGVRALVVDGVVVSRNLKPIPNAHVQRLFGGSHMNGCDGELIVGDAFGPTVFDRTQSGVMSQDGKPDVFYHVFDNWRVDGGLGAHVTNAGYGARMAHLLRMRSDGRWPSRAILVPQHKVFSPKDLAEYEAQTLAQGFEGVMLRRLAKDTPYKYGRSTLKEGLLMKLIRRNTMEGVVVGAVEQLHNENALERDARGYAKRSKVKAGLVPTGKLGALKLGRLIQLPDGEIDWETDYFEVGTGFTDEQRNALWRDRKSLKGKVVTVEYREMTKDNVPRFPVFKGFRHANDMS